ncbi:hypothetical protein [Corynebacterium sp. HMSC28B08]|uniref:hypothetical protein n=1 Tax=Corynebacterium sp. HMSC28B08 TaxID=1581066 RepID=UPI0008A2FB12|nr:hypothetical protein [Corynebacterium sp. HMSC28B08]OFT89000.1 hypothetical protein HMPREF3098_06805 [Corynebacterium sp. HMSC28B08]
MSLPSVEKLQELLRSTTPGPWQWTTPDIGPKGAYGVPVRLHHSYTVGGANRELVALAPELAEEVIRLRGHLMLLQRDMRHQPDNYLASEVANAIRLILEGEE